MNARAGDTSRTASELHADPTSIVRVWDPIVRLFHWTVVAGCAINLLSQSGNRTHRVVGYVVAAALAIRIVWGFVSRGHARFSAFVPTPATMRHYLRQLKARSVPRYIGHNPAGSIMILGLMSLLAAVSITGWMLGLDRYFGNETLEDLHEALAMAIVPLAGIHVVAAVLEGARHGENLIKSMFTGRKRAPSGTDVDHATDSH